MNLLPKNPEEFNRPEYWDKFFEKRGTKAFDWYGEYLELSTYLHKYIKLKDNILMIGCGNSNLSADLYDAGFVNITNIDISDVVIKNMNRINNKKRPNMSFLQMDAYNMKFDENKFNVVLDKGTLDALMSEKNDETNERIDKYFSEISRVLCMGGRYICVSLLQKHINEKIVDYFANNNWMLRIVRCHEAEEILEENGSQTVLPIFIVIITKFKNLPQLLMELSLVQNKLVRINVKEEMIESIKTAQYADSAIRSIANRDTVLPQPVSLDLILPNQSQPRYTVHVIDQRISKPKGEYAAFIVPQGRESEWLFSTADGQRSLLKTTGYKCLAIVSFHREQEYENFETVKKEVSGAILKLAPKGIKGKIPFLSMGDDIGERKLLHKGSSEYTGKYVIEEVTSNDNIYRRLIFLNNQSIIQSESRLKKVVNNAGKSELEVDPGYLACIHHLYMIIGIQLAVKNEAKINSLIIGLGGGGLCNFLMRCMKTLDITAVDIDSEMIEVAEKYFGLVRSEKLKIIIDDGLNFLDQCRQQNTKFRAILFDVDSKDSTIGLSCPPKQFVHQNVLKNVRECLDNEGYFLLNLVCRDDKIRSTTISDLKSVFANIVSYKFDEDLNEIFYCTNKKEVRWIDDFKKAAEIFNKSIKINNLNEENLINIEEIKKCINLNL